MRTRQPTRTVGLTLAAVAYTGFVILVLTLAGRAIADASSANARGRLVSDLVTVWTLLGLAWTVVILIASAMAIRDDSWAAFLCLGSLTLSAVGLREFLPAWYRGLNAAGASTGEFIDMFLIVGGVLPGGQGTLLLISLAWALAVLTIVRLGATARRAFQGDRRRRRDSETR
jgi:hypothetical protein